MIEKNKIGNQVEVVFKISKDVFINFKPDSVEVRGELSDWGYSWKVGLPMIKVGEYWTASIRMPIEASLNRNFQFRYFASGPDKSDWFDDYQADDRVPNKYGSRNSVVDFSPQGFTVKPAFVLTVNA